MQVSFYQQAYRFQDIIWGVNSNRFWHLHALRKCAKAVPGIETSRAFPVKLGRHFSGLSGRPPRCFPSSVGMTRKLRLVVSVYWSGTKKCEGEGAWPPFFFFGNCCFRIYRKIDFDQSTCTPIPTDYRFWTVLEKLLLSSGKKTRNNSYPLLLVFWGFMGVCMYCFIFLNCQ